MRIMKTELRKALNNRMFLVALMIGCAIAIINVCENANMVQEMTRLLHKGIAAGSTASRSPLGFSLFIHWIAVEPISLGHSIYFFVWPILAALPYGWAYCQERKSGLYNQYLIRTSKIKCFLSKYIAMFVSGGISVSLPLLLNLLLNALVCPYALPKAIVPISLVTDGYFMSELYYTYPWVYACIWCAVVFLIGGATACLCLIVGTRFRLRVAVILTPFTLFAIIEGILTLIGSFITLRINFSPLDLPVAAGPLANPEWSVFALLFGIVAVGVIGGYIQVVHHELA